MCATQPRPARSPSKVEGAPKNGSSRSDAHPSRTETGLPRSARPRLSEYRRKKELGSARKGRLGDAARKTSRALSVVKARSASEAAKLKVTSLHRPRHVEPSRGTYIEYAQNGALYIASVRCSSYARAAAILLRDSLCRRTERVRCATATTGSTKPNRLPSTLFVLHLPQSTIN